ncbi:LysR family transcriptional regulator [Oceanobacillus profundus]|uniref:LysR family transcriptional regulator n=2 Tax=Bacillaceae TaxID=186817 RepID=A0A417YPL8_9BACI|nr:LysR family transcriptional regulator [Oceanobacillus profundus]PAE29029.1 LysR family transcriptional regulator [Paenibacillus sp. 7884-2]RHW35637.1 LysR family transcriptional regulator [Oceanobacillus profundus]
MKHLQYFIEVTRAGSFTHAAEKLYMTQPAISRIIKSLEDELEASLFIRSRKKLSLTDAGKILYEHAQVMEKQFQALRLELESLSFLKKGHIRIGLPSIIDSVFFSKLIASFHKEYPDITFQLIEDGSKRIEEKVMNDHLDFGVVFLPTRHNFFDCYSLGEEDLKLIVPADHELVNRQEVAIAELKEEDFIMFNKDFALHDHIYSACRKSGFEPRIISETSQMDFIEEMVASNLGITLLPESTIKGLKRDVKEIKLSHPTIKWHLAMIWKKNQALSPVKLEFIRFAKVNLNNT